MFVVLTYDINQKRVGKVLKTCRKYLVHEQKSVFEGIITEAKLAKLKSELTKLIDFDEDSITIYSINVNKNVAKEQIGVVAEHSCIL